VKSLKSEMAHRVPNGQAAIRKYTRSNAFCQSRRILGLVRGLGSQVSAQSAAGSVATPGGRGWNCNEIEK